jgi:hypothetical protein
MLAGKRKSVIPTRGGIIKLIKNTGPSKDSLITLLQEINGFIKPIDARHGKPSSINRTDAILNIFERQRMEDGVTLARKRRIFVPGIKNGVDPRGRKNLTPLWGCHQACLVLYESLIELGKKFSVDLKPVIVRTIISSKTEKGKTILRPHTFVYFVFKGRTLCADPFNETIRLVKKKELRKISFGIGKSRVMAPRPIGYEEFKREKRNSSPYNPENANAES